MLKKRLVIGGGMSNIQQETRPSGASGEEALPTSGDEGGEPDLIRLDPAILEALSVKPRHCKITPHGQAGFSSSSKITTVIDGETKHYFLKTGPGGDMFKGEHASLAALHLAVPSICPMALAYGKLSSSPGYFLLTEFLDISNCRGGTGSGLSLPQKLAKLHSVTAPIPEGQNQPMFGFPVTTYCGATPQSNTHRSSWSEFYAEDRLRAICKIIEQNHGTSGELRTWVEKIALQVVPKLLRNGHLGGKRGIQPVLVHGDLWSGNKARGRIGDQGAIEDVVFDPSCCYAHSEYELGIMGMFGGFSAGFFSEYHKLVPKTEPKDEYEDRIELYQLYHYLNHYALFGGGYRGDAMDIMKRLYAKYGGE